MKPLGNILIVAIAAGLLAAMMWSNPNYARAIRPFVSTAAPGQTGQTRLIAGRFLSWQTADRIAFSAFGRDMLRDSGGLFLIVDLALSGTLRSTPVEAVWIGASQRRYAATTRIQGLPRQLDSLCLQPGLESKTFAIFELPPDEVQGGALLLAQKQQQPLEGNLRLESPTTAPEHLPIKRFTP